MSQIELAEEAVRRLSPEDRVRFRSWYAEFDAESWDREMEADAAAGRLNWLADEARAELRSGHCTDR